MQETIEIEIRQVYGQDRFYPQCEKGLLFAELIGTKTLTTTALAIIKELGYKIELKTPENPLDHIFN